MIRTSAAYWFDVNDADTAVIISIRPRHGDLSHHFADEAVIVPSASDGAARAVDREVARLRRGDRLRAVVAFALGASAGTVLALLLNPMAFPIAPLLLGLVLGGCAAGLAWNWRGDVRLLDLPMRVGMYAQKIKESTILTLTASERDALERAHDESTDLFLTTLQLIQQRHAAATAMRHEESDRRLQEDAARLLGG